MRAAVHERYGPPEVLHIREVPQPEPAENEVLVHVRASTVTRTDCGLRVASPFFVRFFTGLLRPKQTIIGMEFAGEIVAVGAEVEDFAPGDRVFGVKRGSNADYVCVKTSGSIARVPAEIPFEQAAAVADGGCSALSTLRQAGLKPGQRVVVYGASGSIGTAAVQAAKNQGAHVTAVCGPNALELARSLGADEVVDYTREDYAARGATYDLVFDAVGKSSYRRCRRALKPDGLYMTMDGGFMWHAPLLGLVSKRVKLGVARYRKEDVETLAAMIEAGAYRPVIDRAYPLDEVVEATRYVEAGQKTGNVVLDISMSGMLRHVDVRGRRIAYRRAGSGEPLILLHGFLCDSRAWRRQLAELRDEFDVVAWDAPGAGRSPDPPDRFALADWASCLAAFLEALDLAPAHVVGLSWGGLLAQELFRVARGRVRTLVLADTYAGWKGSFGDAVAQQRLERCERESLLPAKEFVRMWVPLEFFTESVAPDLVEEMTAVVRDFHPRGFRLMAHSLAETDTTGLLPSIDVPTLLLWGDDDRRSPLDVAAAFEAAVPNAELCVIENAGHVSNMERPDEFNAHVRRFARSN